MSKEEYLQGLICNNLSASDMVCGLLRHYVFAGSSTNEMHREICLMASAKAADEAMDRVRNAALILERTEAA